MKTGLSLTELAAEIERQAATKKDFLASTEQLSLVPMFHAETQEIVKGATRPEASTALVIGRKDPLAINKLAHSQIAETLGIPGKYYGIMQSAAPELLAANVNHWFNKTPQKRMIRTLDGNVRAFLSDRYRPLENFDLAEAVLPVLMDMDVEIMSAEITETRLYIKAVHRSIRKDMPAGAQFGQDHVIFRTQSPGIVISNSETGCGAVSVEASVFDHVCTNLAVFGQHSMRKYHTGAKHELAADNLQHLLSDEARKATDAAVWLQVRDVVRGAFDEVVFGKRVDQIAGLAECKIEGDPVEVVNVTAKRLSLSLDENKSVLRHLIQGGNLSALGLYNAVTRTAQDVKDYDRASELERMGGRLVDLPRTEWREIAKAA